MGRYFGTDGVRGRFGVTLNGEMAYRIGRFIGGYGFDTPKKILLSRDTRESGVILSEELIRGIVESGGTVYDLGVSTTPSVSYLVRAEEFDFGIMVSASHNPYFDNGIKVFANTGEKLSASIEDRIEDFMDLPVVPVGPNNGKGIDAADLKEKYIAWLLAKASPKLKGLRVLADLANGSATAIAPTLFARIGIEASYIGNEPDGRNINRDCGSTHIDGLRKAFVEGDYDLGFCFDGDADRFMAIGPDGRVIDGDAQIFLSALSMREEGTLHENKVVITVMSNFGLRKALGKEGIGFDIVSVGDKYVQARLKEGGLSLGGEQSGHVIYLDELNTGDGFLSALHIGNLFVEKPETFKKIAELRVYPQILENLRLEKKEDIARAMEEPSVRAAIDAASAKLGDDGRVLVRPSGTEPLIRVMAEALEESECAAAVKSIVEAIKGVC